MAMDIHCIDHSSNFVKQNIPGLNTINLSGYLFKMLFMVYSPTAHPSHNYLMEETTSALLKPA